MSSGMVAENSIDWRFLGSGATSLRTSRMKPMSSMRSASSRMKHCHRVQPDMLLLHQVEQAARRGDEDVDAARMARTWLFWLTPPRITASFRFKRRP